MKQSNGVLLWLCILVCVLFFSGPCQAGFLSKTFCLKATIVAQPADRGGIVYLSRSINKAGYYSSVEDDNTIESKVLSDGKNTDAAVIYKDDFASKKSSEITFRFIASPNKGYKFGSWTLSDGTSISNNPASQTIECRTSGTDVPYDVGTYYANFVASKVDNVVSKTDVAVSGNPYGVSNEGTVVFAVSYANGIADFTCLISGEGFAFANGSYENSATYNSSNGQITIRYKYTADNEAGKHGGIITLTSKGFDDGKDPSSLSESIFANVDLTPSFSVSDYNYNVDNVVIVGASILNKEGALTPTYQNEAAKTEMAIGNKNGTIWSVWLTDNTNNAFTVVGTPDTDGKYHPEKGKAIVKLLPMQAGSYSAKLYVQCTYYDKNGMASVSTEQTITLSATATLSQQSKLTFNNTEGYAHRFKDTYCNEKIENIISLKVENVINLQCSMTGNDDNVFAYNFGDGQVVISLLSAKPGDYSATLTISGDDSREGQSGKTSATMQVSGKVLLHTPELTALSGHSQVTLRWQPIVGATGYRLQIGTETPITISADKTEYVHSNLSVNQTYTYTLTAVYAPDETYNTTSATATATSGVITAESASATGLQTGTQHPTYNTFPYKKLRDIDLSAAFANGKAACNWLYIFGVTTNTDGATVTVNGKNYPVITGPSAQKPANAKTPCYIYQKDGDNYRYEETIENMNVADKPSRFNISANGQKLYFTGYCPYASCGYKETDNGVICIFRSKNQNPNIDIYLDNLQLYPRIKKEKGLYYSKDPYHADTTTIGISDFGWALKYYVQGSGGALVFHNKNKDKEFNPKVHLSGDNTLKSTNGRVIRLTYSDKVLQAGQYSSPIHILATDNDSKTILSIDDEWFKRNASGTERVNGILRLENSVKNSPSIDLGNQQNTINFNGGRIYMRNAIPFSGAYKTAFAVSWRKFEKTVGPISATMYGLGQDQANGGVNFNDGTIFCMPLLESDIAAAYRSFYRDYTSMKCPTTVKINGGTFNSMVWACDAAASLGGSPTNMHGDPLTRVGFKANSVDGYDLQSSPIVFNNVMYNNETLADHYQNNPNCGYNQNSITPTDKDSVFYIIPSDKVVQDVGLIPWVLCIPELKAGSTGKEMIMGGDKDVTSTDKTKTLRLLYGSFDDYMVNALSGYVSPSLGATVKMTDQRKKHQEILNTSDYAIEDRVYMILPLVADQWRMFVPPFDVSKVSIIESYPDDLATKETVDAARKNQARHTLDFLYYCCEGIEFYNNSAVGLDNFKNSWINYTYKNYNYRPQIIELTHATENNWFDAHYYLYHSSGTWSFDGTNFTTDWQPAAVENKQFDGTTHPVVMKQGEIYAFEFPYKQGNDYTKWDYWTGKYLLLEGYGPQTLHGTKYASEVTGDYLVSGSASLRGNATFADMTVPQKSNAYYLTTSTSGNTEQNKYIAGANQSRTLEPAEGFLLANIPASSAPARAIAINTGVVTYDQETETTTGVPTIAGGRTLIVNSVDGGLTVIPVVAQQVGIYGSAGQLIASDYMTDETTLSLPAGIYMVRGEKETAKVIVR